MEKNRELYSLAVISLIAFLSYFNTLTGSFHYDDYNYILGNVDFKNYVEHFSISLPLFSLTNRSVVLTSFYLNHSLHGFAVPGFHIVNLLIHIFTCLLVFLFIKEIFKAGRLFNKQEYCKNNLNIPLVAALLFAVHPLNIQAVSYISNRSTLMATFFYLLTLLFFMRGVRSRSHLKKYLYIVLIALSFVSGYGSKQIIITAPLLILIYYLLFHPNISLLSNTGKSIFKRFAQVLWLLIATSPFMLIVISKYISYESLSGTHSKFLSLFSGTVLMALALTKDYFSSFIYLLTEFKAIVFFYLKLIVFPFNQNIDPDFQLAQGITDPPVLFSLFFIIFALLIGLYFYKKNPLITFGIFWFYITLLPTSSVIPLLDPVAEHRMYLPGIGILIIMSVVLNSFFRKVQSNSIGRIPGLLVFFLPVVIFSILTIQRNFVWQEEVTLWRDAANKSPFFARPFNNLGEAYEKKANYQNAIIVLKKAIAISPNYDYAHNNLGTVYGKLNKYNLAIKEYKLTLEANDRFTTAHFNLGKAYEMSGMLDNAIMEYSLTIEQKPDFHQAYFNLAKTYSTQKEFPKAVETFQNFLKVKPSSPAAYFELGNISIKTGKQDEAFNYFSKSTELDKNYIPARAAIGNIFMMRGDFSKAEEAFLGILKDDPGNFTAYNNLGLIYLQHKKDPSQAVLYFKKSLKIKPGQPDAKSLREIINKNSQ